MYTYTTGDQLNEIMRAASADYDHLIAEDDRRGRGHSFSHHRYVPRLEGIGPTLRVDAVFNEGEGMIGAARIQAKIRDPRDEEPYLILDAEVHPLSGICRINFGENSSPGNVFDPPHYALMMRDLGARVGLAGHEDASRTFLEQLDRKSRLGWPAFERTYLQVAMLKNRHAPHVPKEELEPGRWYLNGYIPPTDQLCLQLFQIRRFDTKVVPEDTGVRFEMTQDGQHLLIGPHATYYDNRLIFTHGREEMARTVEVSDEWAAGVSRHVTPPFKPEVDIKYIACE